MHRGNCRRNEPIFKREIMKIEIKHTLNAEYATGIESTTKTWKLFGIVVWQKTHHYPKLQFFEILFKI